MILDLNLSNNSFTKFLALILDANELIADIDYEDKEPYSHRLSHRVYKMITQNDNKEFNQMLSHLLSELNLLAMRTPYSNQNTLLLIDALHTITSDIHYYEDLKDFFPDIKFIYIPEFSWDDYRKQQSQPQHNSVNEEKLSPVESNDFDFDDEILSKDFNNEQTTVDDKQLNDDFVFDDSSAFDCGDSEVSSTRTIAERVIKKPSLINEEAAEMRAAAQAAALVESATLNNKNKNVNEEIKREFKPWVKPLFGIFAFMLIAALIISWMY
ncbi:hypothetical protein ACI51W_03505 [Pseudomonas marginalis]|uniref:hypothetical protein n=1 Tax=Pseudomonas marginalis TaxID=298 RepID=UPI00386DA732